MDVLSRAFEELGLRKASFRAFEARGANWALSYDAGVRGMHFIDAGGAELRMGVRRAPLDAGDLVFVLDGARHELRARGGEGAAPVVRARDLVARSRPEGPIVLGARRDPPSCELLCGAFSLEADDHPMLASLGWLHLRRATIAASPRLSSWLSALREEVMSPRPGSHSQTARLCELLFIEALRVQGEVSSECPAGGWFRGLRDPALARALSAFHREMAADWTVARLAETAGMSRSAFAARFASLLGEAPLAHVRRWRLFRARRLLETTTGSLEEIAERVGYGSAAALSLAFARESGASPGAWRARRRASRDER